MQGMEPEGAAWLRGEPRPPAPAILRAGPLVAEFEPSTGWLRRIRLGDFEVIRAIYGAVRDRGWGTVQPRVSELQIDSSERQFLVTFVAECRRDGIDFAWRGVVVGTPDGTILYRFSGEARAAFERNRIGLCVLHPVVECAGKPCRVGHVDGSEEGSIFPRLVSPHQPFFSVRSIRHEAAPGVWAEVRFGGEVFETEDQRNWTDASFKTYSTPLSVPFPVRVEAGTRVEQWVELRVEGAVKKILPVVQGRGAQLSIVTTPVWMRPPVGLQLAEGGGALAPRELARLRILRPGHVRADVRLGKEGWREALERGLEVATALDCGLQLALYLSEEAERELTGLVEAVAGRAGRITVWLILPAAGTVTSPEAVRLAREHLAGRSARGSLIAAGTEGSFVELNRTRPTVGETALPCYAMNPQVHAEDWGTLVENLAGQPWTVESTQEFARRTVVVSPVTFRARVEGTGGAGVPGDVDGRQRALSGAAWTVGSLARLLTTGSVHSLTYYETVGWRGVMERETGPERAELGAAMGGVYPLFHVLADLAGWDRVCRMQSTHPLQLDGVCLINATGRRRLLLANLMDESQEIRIKTGSVGGVLRRLDEGVLVRAVRDPEGYRTAPGEHIRPAGGKLELNLGAFAVATVDLEG